MHHSLYPFTVPFFIFSILVFGAGASFVGAQTDGQTAYVYVESEHEKALDLEDLAALLQPSVIPVVTHVTGTYTSYPIKINLQNLSISVDTTSEPEVVEVSEYIYGSAFFVSTDGHLVTNAHVVSDETIKLNLAGLASSVKLYQVALTASLEDEQALLSHGDQELQDFGERIVRFVLETNDYNLTANIVALSPVSTGRDLELLFDEGYPVEVIDVNEDFFNNDNDVALLKIAEKNTPALVISDGETISIGEEVYLMGYPISGQFNDVDYMQPSFTKGIINAIKQSDRSDISAYQTGAKISQGSSGGPLVTGHGEVAGIVTQQSDPLLQGTGDNFAFVLPSYLIRQILADNNVLNVQGMYGNHFLEGIRLLKSKSCRDANVAFSTALASVDGRFKTDPLLREHIEYCSGLIVSGQSLDSRWDNIRSQIRSLGVTLWYVSAGIAIVLLLILWITLRFLRATRTFQVQQTSETVSELNLPKGAAEQRPRIRESVSMYDADAAVARKETMVEGSGGVVEEEPSAETISESDTTGADGSPFAKPDLDPVLVTYVREARGSSVPDVLIRENLQRAGWSNQEVMEALRT